MSAQLSADSLPQKREHNFGVDLLRCVGMLMIVTLHILNRGGAADGFAGGMDIAVKTFRFFCSACCCSAACASAKGSTVSSSAFAIGLR